MSEIIEIKAAQERILSVFSGPKPEQIWVVDALGRTLMENIVSPINLPPFTNSSMDGFAVFSGDVAGASAEHPVRLLTSMDIPAGVTPPAQLERGHAARILTGAVLPEGADAVIQLEDTDQNLASQVKALPASVTFFKPVQPGMNVRSAGEDVQKGQIILKTGRHLQPQDIGILVSLGIHTITVARKPRVALFSSGDELLTPDQAMAPGKIYDANTYVLTGLLEQAGAEIIQLGIARDNYDSVVDILEHGLDNPPDLFLSSAGVSVGVYDWVRQVIEENGKLDFWRVNMRPGKPVAFGNYKGIPFLGLPGNPVSAYIGAMVFVLPILRQLQGLPVHSSRFIKVRTRQTLSSSDGRESYYRGMISKTENGYEAVLAGHQGSGNLYSLVQANCLLIVPAGVSQIPEGEIVDAWLLEDIQAE